VPERLVVIGADAGGMTAAMQARRRRPYLEIVALEKGSWTSYSACGIPYLVGGEVASLDDLVARTPADLREQRIDVRLRHEVLGIDLAGRTLEVRDHARQRTIPIEFDQLHVATGARPTRPDVPGIDLDQVRGVQTLDDARALLDHARVSRCKCVVVVGGGYIGLEMAEAFVRWGAQVTLVEGSDQLMRTLDPDMAERLLAPMRAMGIDVRLGTPVEGFEPGRVVTVGGETIPADLVVLGLGVTPNGELAGGAGAATGARGALVVDRRQRTTLDGVYAAGDCCESRHLVSGRRTHVALGTVANKQGRVAGINLGGGYATFPGVVGTAITKVCNLEVARTGLSEREAAAEGFAAAAVSVESTTIAGYMPDTKPMTVKLIGERGTGRVLGAQIVGEDGSAKRIDTLATALHARMRVDDLIDLDLAYAPPFGSTWDPIHIAARRLVDEL
jgi:NADPH-dependent 2,4-dienoyl-CoA reductase/sulfur reductase-like enzyme